MLYVFVRKTYATLVVVAVVVAVGAVVVILIVLVNAIAVRPCLLEAAAIFLIGAMFGVTFGPSPHAGTWTWPLAYLHAIKVISWDCRSFSLWFESISGIPICSVNAS